MTNDEALEQADFLLGQVAVRMQHRVDAIQEKGLESVSISPGFARDIVRACTNGRIAIGRSALSEPDAKEAECERLREVLKDCADDLEDELQRRYANTLQYPDHKLCYNRDMEPVNRARALLNEKQAVSGGE